MTKESTTTAPKKRWYLDDGKTNPSILVEGLAPTIHSLFCQWVKSHWHERDFVESVEHMATSLYCEYLMMGSPNLSREIVKWEPLPLEPRNPPPAQRLTGPRLRFYDAEGNLEMGLDSDTQRRALAPLFIVWVQRGYHERDFCQAVKDTALSEYHSYTIVTSLNGLGGGQTPTEFLNTPHQY